jgi:hypothetical protein
MLVSVIEPVAYVLYLCKYREIGGIVTPLKKASIILSPSRISASFVDVTCRNELSVVILLILFP